MPRGIYKRNTRSVAQLQRTINGLEAQLENTQQVVRNQAEALNTLQARLSEAYKLRDELVAQRDAAVGRAAEFEQHNGRLYSQTLQLRADIETNKREIQRSLGALRQSEHAIAMMDARMEAQKEAYLSVIESMGSALLSAG